MSRVIETLRALDSLRERSEGDDDEVTKIVVNSCQKDQLTQLDLEVILELWVYKEKKNTRYLEGLNTIMARIELKNTASIFHTFSGIRKIDELLVFAANGFDCLEILTFTSGAEVTYMQTFLSICITAFAPSMDVRLIFWYLHTADIEFLSCVSGRKMLYTMPSRFVTEDVLSTYMYYHCAHRVDSIDKHMIKQIVARCGDDGDSLVADGLKKAHSSVHTFVRPDVEFALLFDVLIET